VIIGVLLDGMKGLMCVIGIDTTADCANTVVRNEVSTPSGAV
jgi:hypothetical protein